MTQLSGCDNPPSLILALWNIGILPHKQATLGKHFEPKCMKKFEKYVLETPEHKILLQKIYKNIIEKCSVGNSQKNNK